MHITRLHPTSSGETKTQTSQTLSREILQSKAGQRSVNKDSFFFTIYGKFH